MERTRERQAGFRCLTEALDKTTSGGCRMQMVGAFLKKVERAMISDRFRARLTAIRINARISRRSLQLRPARAGSAVCTSRVGERYLCRPENNVHRSAI